jgi:hypothetical protein
MPVRSNEQCDPSSVAGSAARLARRKNFDGLHAAFYEDAGAQAADRLDGQNRPSSGRSASGR